MKNCPVCGSPHRDDAVFCGDCGANFNALDNDEAHARYRAETRSARPRSAAEAIAAVRESSVSHSDEFTDEDISSGKPWAILCYVFSVFGIILAMIADGNNPYVKFHALQSVKILISFMLWYLVELVACIPIGIVSAILVFLKLNIVAIILVGILAVAAIIVTIVFFLLVLIAIIQVGKGKAKEPAIVSKLGFLS